MQKSYFKISWTAILAICWLFLFAVPQIASAEAFTIRQYDVSVKLNPDGSARITERIEVHFSEKRRGIYRNIPYKYTNRAVEGKRARRSQGGAYYETIIKDVQVKGHPFQLFEEEAYLVIRIGDPDVFLTGKQVYEISYTVWGALNDFGDNIEFSWNIIGTEWDTYIDNVSYSIQFPRDRSIGNDDALVFTGRTGSTESDVEFQLQRGRITGKTTRQLSPREGVTVALRFPPDFFDNVDIPLSEFAERFYVDDHSARVTINDDASLDVVEKYHVFFVKPTTGFTRSLEINPVVFQEKKQFVFIDKEALYVELSPSIPVQIQINRRSNKDLINVSSAQQPFSGKVIFTFRYKVWGAIGQSGNDALLKWELMNLDADEPVRQSSFSFQLPGNTILEKDRVDVKIENRHHILKEERQLETAAGTLEGKFTRQLLHGEGYTVAFPITDAPIDFSAIPLQVFAQYYVIDNMRTDIYLEKGGVVRIRQELDPDFIYPENQDYFEPYFKTAFYRNDTLSMPNSNWLAAKHKPLILDIDLPDKDKYKVNQYMDKNIIALDKPWKAEWDDPFEWEFKQYGILEKSGGEFTLKYPLLFPMNDPVRQGTFRVHFPDDIDPDKVSARIMSTDGRIDQEADVRKDGVRGIFLDYLRPEEGLVLTLNAPKKYIRGFRPDLWTRLYLKNNIYLLLAALFAGILTLIWYYFGRDPQDAVVVQYYPPKDITPAEAGLLWDDKLHKKDLISLIYYWASKGILKIREEGESKKDRDYTLIKKKPLPSDAKPFEKIMFDGLFKNNDSQKVSELRDSYYTTMKSADKSLERYGKQHHFYQPGTRGFGCLIKIVGFALLLVGVFMLGVGYFTDNYSIGLPATALGIVTLLIARVMPKKGPFGHKKYMELLGFAEFVRRAEIDRIKVLVEENPRYFDETIAYAIVFGMGERWAEQFDDLMTEPPEWYDGQYRNRPFRPIYLVNDMTRSMNKMNTDFNYKSPPQSTSSWGGSGGSSFGGGGFSGGGFGGGGGGSW